MLDKVPKKQNLKGLRGIFMVQKLLEGRKSNFFHGEKCLLVGLASDCCTEYFQSCNGLTSARRG